MYPSEKMNRAKKTLRTSSPTETCWVPRRSETISVPQIPPRVIGPTRSLPRRYPAASDRNRASSGWSRIMPMAPQRRAGAVRTGGMCMKGS
ncbi:Hypothetical protein XNRR2_4169 [Streptomyces albidoflavus]|nr:Hypothetical protein XNR_4169 [Streptomyces albidoflavus]QLP94356.1 Hypothetical protein XNRR2_4169 [Streptomyces albidoflavus]WAE12685.1 Hypothetical protein SAD14_4169 [Streptomyces albidoflavus]WAE18325.1 Hypothetical protein SAD14N_4169 [Streptomyces albidoflavus]